MSTGGPLWQRAKAGCIGYALRLPFAEGVAMEITTDERDESRKSNLRMTRDADWSDVEAAVRGLNGKSRTEVTIAAKADGAYMGIGGGPSRYFVFIWTDDERSLILTDPRRDEAPEKLVVGGQAAA